MLRLLTAARAPRVRYAAASGSDVYRLNLDQGRFLAPLQTKSAAVNRLGVNPVRKLLPPLPAPPAARLPLLLLLGNEAQTPLLDGVCGNLYPPFLPV